MERSQTKRVLAALSTEDATLYAGWFKVWPTPCGSGCSTCLPTERRPMAVGEIVEHLPIGRPTVSHHLKVLADVRFVPAERIGASTRYQVNGAGLERFPGRRPSDHGSLMNITPLTTAHAERVLRIHQLGINEGNATFETTAPTWQAFDATKLPEHRFAALDDDGTVLGWVAATKVPAAAPTPASSSTRSTSTPTPAGAAPPPDRPSRRGRLRRGLRCGHP
ncbi:hypothetical protein GCM10010381_66670 [Streptomyces xantholiticus]|nr:hypothetical protein GCM10010381_66670 [Streptomyces xantholiticus]